MKKFVKTVIFVTLMCLSFGTFAQNGFVPVYVIADTSLKINRILETGTPIYVVSENKFYFTTTRIGVPNFYNVNWLIADSTRYEQPDFTSSTSMSTAYLNATYIKGTHSNYTADSSTTAVASSTDKALYQVFSSTDTSANCPVGGLAYRAADSTLWLRIKATGVKSARWNKVTVGK